jgi:hypothetical protein
MGLLAKADCQRLIAESLPKCFGCGYAALGYKVNPSSKKPRRSAIHSLSFAVTRFKNSAYSECP